MKRTDEELVRDALDHIATLKRHLGQNNLDNETVVDAVSLRLAATIEALANTSNDFREQTFGDTWKVISATRNRIVHGYAFINLAMIRATVEHDLPDLERLLLSSIGE